MSGAPVLSNFRVHLPAHRGSHADIVRWLAAAHARSEETVRAGDPGFDPGAFRRQMERHLRRFAPSPETVGFRYSEIDEFLDEEFSRKDLFPLDRVPQGASTGARMDAFADFAERALRALYEPETNPEGAREYGGVVRLPRLRSVSGTQDPLRKRRGFLFGNFGFSETMKSALFPAVFLLLLAHVPAVAEGGASRAEIDSLLSFVRRQEGAAFLRNGASHDAAQAEAHLRLKWSRQEKKIRTPEDFIALCASRSYLTGQPYRIRFKDGTVRDTEAVLREELQRMRGASSRP